MISNKFKSEKTHQEGALYKLKNNFYTNKNS